MIYYVCENWSKNFSRSVPNCRFSKDEYITCLFSANKAHQCTSFPICHFILIDPYLKQICTFQFTIHDSPDMTKFHSISGGLRDHLFLLFPLACVSKPFSPMFLFLGRILQFTDSLHGLCKPGKFTSCFQNLENCFFSGTFFQLLALYNVQELNRKFYAGSEVSLLVIIRSHRPQPLRTPHEIYTTQFSPLLIRVKHCLYRLGLRTAFTDQY